MSKRRYNKISIASDVHPDEATIVSDLHAAKKSKSNISLKLLQQCIREYGEEYILVSRCYSDTQSIKDSETRKSSNVDTNLLSIYNCNKNILLSTNKTNRNSSDHVISEPINTQIRIDTSSS